jgi:HK97 family phage prohead protease
MTVIHKYFTKAAEETEDRVLRFVGSDESIDRDNEMIKVSGWKLENYKKNPVVLVSHNPTELPVARTKKVWVDKESKALMFDVEFPTADISPQGDSLYKLYKNGFMKATSVGFIPNFEKITYGDTKKGQAHRIFNEQELMEISLVSIPSNPRALLTSKSVKEAIDQKVIDEVEYKDLQMWFEEIFKQDKEKEETANVEVEQKDSNINTEVVKHICKGCGIELELCPSCKEKKDIDDFYKKLYESLIFSK